MFVGLTWTHKKEGPVAMSTPHTRGSRQKRNHQSHNPNGDPSWGKGKGPRKGNQTIQTEGSEEIITLLARMALRAEEETTVLKQDYSLVLSSRPGKNSILHLMYNTAYKWKEEMQKRTEDKAVMNFAWSCLPASFTKSCYVWSP